jgi:hypothetical protein
VRGLGLEVGGQLVDLQCHRSSFFLGRSSPVGVSRVLLGRYRTWSRVPEVAR